MWCLRSITLQPGIEFISAFLLQLFLALLVPHFAVGLDAVVRHFEHHLHVEIPAQSVIELSLFAPSQGYEVIILTRDVIQGPGHRTELPETDGEELLLEGRRAHGDDPGVLRADHARVELLFVHRDNGKPLRIIRDHESLVVIRANDVDAVVVVLGDAALILIHVDDVIRVVNSKPGKREKCIFLFKWKQVFFDMCLQHVVKSSFPPCRGLTLIPQISVYV